MSFFFFFFSSRRRHTRYIGDWSSDVCSSDLDTENTRRQAETRHDAETLRHRGHRGHGGKLLGFSKHLPLCPPCARSEERRVGKECRSRWLRDHEKIKSKRNKSKQRRTEIT